MSWVLAAPGVAEFADDEAGVAFSLAGSGPVLVAFGGMSQLGGPPPFEFTRVAGLLGCRWVAVRDHARFWYHRGARGLGGDFRGMVDGLGVLLETHGRGRVVTVGNSAGGYAACVAAGLLGADAAVAFVPRTALSNDVCLAVGDLEWGWRRSALLAGSHDASLLDVVAVLGEHPVPRVAVHVGSDVRDVAYAQRLAGVEGVEVVSWFGAGHDLVQRLRTSGQLLGLLRRQFAG